MSSIFYIFKKRTFFRIFSLQTDVRYAIIIPEHLFDFLGGDFVDMYEKLCILADAAKYDVACTSSGSSRAGRKDGIGSAVEGGICHSFTADGRCISLLKVLMSNACSYDCQYCVNRKSNDVKRVTFTPRELAQLTIDFYRRNYIEGLFLSSAVVGSPDATSEMMLKVLLLLRNEYKFYGYIHVKAIPGTDEKLLSALGILADRMSVNIELPSHDGLKLLAPDKKKEDILKPMSFIKQGISQNGSDLVKYRYAPRFVPAGQSTQMIIGATNDSDYKILNLTSALYKKYSLKRVFFSAYIPIVEGRNLPALDTKPPLLREHRLYQADWLLRFYGFEASEILDENNPDFNPYIDPKCNWAINHMEFFPVDVNKADREQLLRVPGIGVKCAYKILKARKAGKLDFDGLKKLGVVLKRAKYFITCSGKTMPGIKIEYAPVMSALMSGATYEAYSMQNYEQLSLFDENRLISKEDVVKCLTGQI